MATNRKNVRKSNDKQTASSDKITDLAVNTEDPRTLTLQRTREYVSMTIRIRSRRVIAGHRCSRILFCVRRSRISITSASRSESSMRAALGLMAIFRFISRWRS